MDYTRELADFCSGLSFDDLPGEVIRKAKLCVLDNIANAYGSLELKVVRNIIESFRSQAGTPESSVLGCAFKTGARDAAFLNGTTAEAIEAQDGLRFGGNHPVSAVIPAAYAVAESVGAGGKEFIESVVAGYEAANRIAASVHPLQTFSGFLPTGACGTFGAAAAAAKLMKLGPDGMLNSLGNAGYMAPMSMSEQLMGGYTVKIVQGGQAASVGVTAAFLSADGITGHPRVLEGSELKGGFTQITVRGEPVFERITEGLGEHFTMTDVYFKPYTACRHTHGAIQATLELLEKTNIDAREVESVKVHTYGVATVAVGKGLGENATFVSAQFSIPYVVAACLLDGELGPRQLTEKRISDPAISALAERVTVEMDEELNSLYPDKTASRVQINLKGGETVTKQVDNPKGDPRDPMGEDDISDKVRSFARPGSGNLSAVIKLVSNLEYLENVTELAGLI